MPPPRNSSLGRGLGDLIDGVPRQIGVAGVRPVPAEPPASERPVVAAPDHAVTGQRETPPAPIPAQPERATPPERQAGQRTPARWLAIGAGGMALLFVGVFLGFQMASRVRPRDSGTGEKAGECPELAPPVQAPVVPVQPPVIATGSGASAVLDPSDLEALAEKGLTLMHQAGGTVSLQFQEPLFTRRVALDPARMELLGQVGSVLANHAGEWEVTITGHADAVPLRNAAGFRDNQELGLARAVEVVRQLWRERRVPMTMLRAVSAGDANPPFPGDDDASRRKNRTVTMLIRPAGGAGSTAAPQGE